MRHDRQVFYTKVKNYIRKHQLIEEGDRVIIGLSGGPDSVCLALLLCRLADELKIRISAVHVNHLLRGSAAESDETFVRTFCEKRGISLTVVRRDVADYAKVHGLSTEEAGRMLRREAFETVAEGCSDEEAEDRTKVALAHHMEDQAETVLFHLSRGTGIAGLGGMRPRSGVYIRPLLGVHKAEILSYLKEEGVSYCEDHTNREDAYTRNRIRNHVLPYLKEEVNTRATDHIAALAEQVALADAYISRQTKDLSLLCVSEDAKGIHIDIAVWQKADEILKTAVIRQALSRAAGASKDIEAVHIRDVMDLADKQGEKSIDLPYGLRAVSGYREILIGKRGTGAFSEHYEPSAGQIQTRILKRSELPAIIENLPYTKWFDYAIIPHNPNDVVLRTRRPGDYLVIDRIGHTQTLKKYMINEKIPKSDRDRIPVVASGSEILWVVGYRQNPGYQITDQTETVLEIHFRKEQTGR